MMLRVRGNSMLPFLTPGCRVRCRRGPARKGDIIVAIMPGGTRVVHRAIAGGGTRWRLQGDNLPLHDPAPRRLVGVVTFIEDKGGWRRPDPRVARLAAAVAPVRPGILRRAILQLLHRTDRWLSPPRPYKSSPTKEPLLDMTPRFEFQPLGDEVAVYDAKTGSVHFLNATAAEILRETLAGRSPNEVIDRLHGQFPDVALDRITADVETCLRQLHERNLLETP